MKEYRQYIIKEGAEVSFHNNVDFCIGTGRMGLALQKEYQEQLKFIQDKIGFRYIRGHGLFSDDMAIYNEYEDELGEIKVEYNFTYLDLVMDNYKAVNLRPFLELGFMPEKLASGSQTVFYWNGNVTPPKSYKKWGELIKETLLHLIERYGLEEVIQWPIEVWNEPNLKGFWENADMKEYFKMFEYTFNCIKEIDNRFRVGGPAICGVEDELWVKEFMSFCKNKNIPLDFVTRHHYTTSLPIHKGHYGYAELNEPEEGFRNLETTRSIIDSFKEYRNLEIHITEFNTSYIPNCPLHDTNQNAAYIMHQLTRLGYVNESYSYWTFGDIFEENGVPFTPFHGGFGLVANGCIPKPTFWAFQFMKQLKGKCIHKSCDSVIVECENGVLRGSTWNMGLERKGIELELDFNLPVLNRKNKVNEYCMILKIVDEEVCNPLKNWYDMGQPYSLSTEEKYILKETANPFVLTEVIEVKNNTLNILLSVKENGIIYFELIPIVRKNDRGYDYKKIMQR